MAYSLSDMLSRLGYLHHVVRCREFKVYTEGKPECNRTDGAVVSWAEGNGVTVDLAAKIGTQHAVARTICL